MVKAWLYLYILDYFLLVLFSRNAFFSFSPFVHHFSCQMALLLWQMLWQMLGLYPLYVQILLVVQHL